mmetsp:Transcript_26190/g.32286  ORF Transcript_26190/g.32286 Transcript_26190/m.32286 type:complete len:92 (+) Transcript_26190:150-425(+)
MKPFFPSAPTLSVIEQCKHLLLGSSFHMNVICINKQGFASQSELIMFLGKFIQDRVIVSKWLFLNEESPVCRLDVSPWDDEHNEGIVPFPS